MHIVYLQQQSHNCCILTKISLGLDLDHWHKLLLATFLSSNTAFKTVSLGPQSVCDQFSY